MPSEYQSEERNVGRPRRHASLPQLHPQPLLIVQTRMILSSQGDGIVERLEFFILGLVRVPPFQARPLDQVSQRGGKDGPGTQKGFRSLGEDRRSFSKNSQRSKSSGRQ